jgi:hypothetical protein
MTLSRQTERERGRERERESSNVTKKQNLLHSMTNTCKMLVFDGALPTVPSYQVTAEEATSYYVIQIPYLNM